jgi:hypothetical protein
MRWNTILILSIAACLVVDSFPHFGPPQFRYTGSDPNTHIWNLGWPLATAIYDQHNGVHAGPLVYVLVPMEVVALAAAAIAVAMSRSGGRMAHPARPGNHGP